MAKEPTEDISISQASTRDDFDAINSLFETYATSLGIDLSFQDFTAELNSLPGKYAPPTGALLLARDSAGQAIGCVGLRPLREQNQASDQAPHSTSSSRKCEMKRLYVTPAGRRHGLGKRLAEKIVSLALSMDYEAIVLDTLPSMHSARALYDSLGFVETDAYYVTPIKGTVFLELRL